MTPSLREHSIFFALLRPSSIIFAVLCFGIVPAHSGMSLYPTQNIISSIISRFLHNESDNIIDVGVPLLNTTQLCYKWGLNCETHMAKTEDGYTLTMHRIVPKSGNSPSVLIQHGICMASDSWMLRGKEDLAVILHDSGYDVWLGNIRGNCYSKQHDYMNVKDQAFWDFSWHEHGYYDLPAMIDYVLYYTRRPQLSYIGHSMGTTMFYVMASTRPEYNKKINLQISLAPVAYCSRMKSFYLVFKHLAANRKYFEKILQKEKKYELLERRLANPIAILCKDPTLRPLCYQTAFSIIGPDLLQMPDENIITAIVTYFPAGTSWKNLMHYLQNAMSADFQAYNLGHFENMRRYKEFFPPRYNLSAITAPVALFYSTNDYLSHQADVRLLAYQLPHLVGLYKVPFPYFNHLDYVFARDSRVLLYDSILCLMNLYNQRNTHCALPESKFDRSETYYWREREG